MPLFTIRVASRSSEGGTLLARGSIVVAVIALVLPALARAQTPSQPLQPGDVVQVGELAAVVPAPGSAVLLHVTREPGMEGPTGLSVRTLATGEVIVSMDEPEDRSLSASSPPECDDSAYNLAPLKWYDPFNWYFIAGSAPSNLDLDNTETSLKWSIWNHTTANNSCGLADDIEIASSYLGRITGSVEIGNDASCLSPDTRSEVGFGTLPSGTLAATCTWVQGTRTPQGAYASDIRFNKDQYTWWNSASSCGGEKPVMVEAVGTHERGHTFGLGHVTEADHGRLTMSRKYDGWCSTAEETLGRGDILGLRARGY